MSVAIGSTVAHFKILGKIGAGGMGEVYRATDTKLGREVAFKVLPKAMASDPERLSRFQREAKTVAALNHPNIVTIHSVDEVDGIHFLTMELVTGKALSDLLPAGGLSLDRLFALAVPIADAVASAHSQDIVHRDLKPENVMVDGQGRVKVLDFGLAKVAEAPVRADGVTGTMPLTEDGRVMGTVPYMSPEQVQGKEVDARSDIFSLGVMLYEMAAGRRPFAGDSSAELMAAIQRDNAETLDAGRRDLPRHLGRIVQHCLEKDPDRRYQSALDVRNELEQLKREVAEEALAPLGPPPSSNKVTRLATDELSMASATSAGAPRRTDTRKWWLAAAAVALLALALAFGYRQLRPEPEASPVPSLVANRVVVAEFENRTDDPSIDHLGRTIAETLTQGLSEISEIDLLPARPLDPASRKDLASAVRRLAEETGASLIVTGDYSPRDGGLRLQARVTAAETMRPLYGIDDISASRAFSEEIVEDFRQRVMGLTVLLNLPSESRVKYSVETWSLSYSKPPRYDAYMEFQAAWHYFGDDYSKAFRHLQRAADLDPDFFWPDNVMASAYSNTGQHAKADAIVARWEERRQELAVAARDQLDALRAALDGRRAEALQHLQAIVRRTPDDINRYVLGYSALMANRPRLAIETFASYLEVEGTEEVRTSKDAWPWANWIAAYHLAGDYGQELSLARRISGSHPQFLSLRLGEVRALIALGEEEELDRMLEEAMATSSSDVSPGDVLKVAAQELRAHGRPEESLRIANRAIDWYLEQETAGGVFSLGSAFCLAGRWQEAQTVFAEVAKDDPQNLHALGYLGVLAARLGEQDEAQRISQRLAAWEDPYVRGWNTYWRASIAAALGDRDAAVEYLRAAFAAGLSFLENKTTYRHADINLEPLRGYPPFDRLMAPK